MSQSRKKEFESPQSWVPRGVCMGENTREIAGLVECFPVIGEIPRCSDILVSRWRVV